MTGSGGFAQRVVRIGFRPGDGTARVIAGHWVDYDLAGRSMRLHGDAEPKLTLEYDGPDFHHGFQRQRRLRTGAGRAGNLFFAGCAGGPSPGSWGVGPGPIDGGARDVGRWSASRPHRHGCR